MVANAIPDDFLDRLFRTIDSKDAEGFAAFLSDNGVFQFGNAPAVSGRDAVKDAVSGFFDTIEGLSHSVMHVWRDEASLACEGEVCYRRLDGSDVVIPFVDVFEFDESLISSYKIYIDIAPLYAE